MKKNIKSFVIVFFMTISYIINYLFSFNGIIAYLIIIVGIFFGSFIYDRFSKKTESK